MMIAASLAACTLAAASTYTSIVDAYKAKDWPYVVAQTTNGFNIIQFRDTAFTKLNLTTNDVEDLAALMTQAGKNKAGIELYRFVSKDNDKALVPFRALVMNNLIAENGKIFLPTFSHTYLQAKDAQLFKLYAQKISATFSTLDDSALIRGLIYASNMIVHWNKLNPTEKVQELPLTNEFVAKLAKKDIFSGVILSEDYEASYRLTKTYYDNCMFNPTALDKFISAVRFRFRNYPVDVDYFAREAFDRTTDCKYRTLFALKVNDMDKLLTALEDMTQDTFSADDVAKILKAFNGQNADWRTADVIKTLKNINSMYTIKLYDDRDAWEPVLSKLRAMIELRQ